MDVNKFRQNQYHLTLILNTLRKVTDDLSELRYALFHLDDSTDFHFCVKY